MCADLLDYLKYFLLHLEVTLFPSLSILDCIRCSSRITLYLLPFTLPLALNSFSVLIEKKISPCMMLPFPYFTVEMVCLEWHAVFFFLIKIILLGIICCTMQKVAFNLTRAPCLTFYSFLSTYILDPIKARFVLYLSIVYQTFLFFLNVVYHIYIYVTNLTLTHNRQAFSCSVIEEAFWWAWKDCLCKKVSSDEYASVLTDLCLFYSSYMYCALILKPNLPCSILGHLLW